MTLSGFLDFLRVHHMEGNGIEKRQCNSKFTDSENSSSHVQALDRQGIGVPKGQSPSLKIQIKNSLVTKIAIDYLFQLW